MKKGLYVGSFDPFTLGHLNIAKKASSLFDTLIIGVGVNIFKKGFFTVEQRIQMIQLSTEIEVISIEGLVADTVKEKEIDCLVRGLRNPLDIEHELSLATFNKNLCGIETLYLASDISYRHIHSKYIQELLHFKQDISPYISPQAASFIQSIK